MKRLYLFAISAAFISTVFSQKPEIADTSWKKIYRGSYPRTNDLVNTKLDVKFDYAKAYLYGKAWVTLTPHFYSTDSLRLDAKGMEILKISMVGKKGMTPLKYEYDGLQLNIHLDRKYAGGEHYTVYFDYVSKPNEIVTKGSAAINDAKGLYFINPKGEDPETPTQIWTQGETEANSVWFPTIDKPNQKSTEEITMTVPDKYVTLSNGKLMSSKKNADGTRTDNWKMELPHAPYLFFMGVGEYSIVKDFYKGKEVNYYVEKAYAPVARKIFGHTPEMMAFYSRITGIEYPWVKYSQIVGRDYVSGAMENTTATLHQESAQQDARELVDENKWEDVISHELFHQWFGDLVTAESWSNLTLNESFANYSETLWNEYKYGKDAGDEHDYKDKTGYLQSQSENKSLVRFRYSDKEDMFDAVSYNKGGRILHMLRNFVGDSAFFKSLNLYLTTNKFKSAEATQLRLSFEEVTGKDLNWFFNQWYFGNGHPKLDISYAYDDDARKVTVTIKQTQSENVFKLPIAIDIYNGSKVQRNQVCMEDREQSFVFSYTSKPDLINVDGDKILLAEKKDHKTLENFIHQFKYAGKYVDKREAVDFCATVSDDPKALAVLLDAAKDKYDGTRLYALGKLDMEKPNVKQAAEALLYEMAKNEKKPIVRARAISMLGEYDSKPEYKTLFAKALNDSSYSVAGAALEAISVSDATGSLVEAKRLSAKTVKGRLAESISQVMIKNAGEEEFDIIAGNFDRMPFGQEKFQAMQPFAAFVGKIKDLGKFKKGIDMIVAFRESVPPAYQSQLAPFFDNVIFKGILAQKTAAKTGGNELVIQQQIDYLNSKAKAK
ncbi:MAG: M1 family aminopeptidase [Chitinophagaceae bacterium]